MTVAELMEKLKEFPQELEVRIGGGCELVFDVIDDEFLEGHVPFIWVLADMQRGAYGREND